jgi:hypothetical protein
VKRFTWLLLAVFCTALVQIQPVEGLVKAKTFPCCRIPGACGMPGCCAPTPSSPLADRPGQATLALSVVCRKVLPARTVAKNFDCFFLEEANTRSSIVAAAHAAPAADVPLFTAHCSLLI